jgi:PAS domain S-box-containing protein
MPILLCLRLPAAHFDELADSAELPPMGTKLALWAHMSTPPRSGNDMPALQPPGGKRNNLAPGRETLEREAAYRRGEELAARRARGEKIVKHAAAVPFALSSLIEEVREYAMFVADADGIIQLWGESARLMKWFTKEQAEGAHLRMLYPDGGSDDGTAEAHLEQAAERGEYTGEGERVRSDGSTFWARVTLTAIKDHEGKLLGFAKVVRDFTAQHAAEARIRVALEASARAQHRAEEASRAKSLFIATVSHEIRNPINAILGYLHLLEHQTSGALSDAHRNQLGRIRTVSNHLLGVLDDLLDSTRLEAGRLTVDGAYVRLGEAIEAALTLVAPQARVKGVELSNAVPGYGADVTYFGDENRVRQILVNLLGNAIKFTPAGGRVQVSAGTAESPSPNTQLEGPPPWAYVRVEDTGRGIPPEEMRRIFEPFQQADAAPTEGTGLGLAISRRLARLMGGDLTARSQPGRGSAFFLWLPAAPGTTPADDPRTAIPDQGSPQ